MTEQPDALLFAALEGWWNASRSGLAADGVTATLQGPFDAPGMDPVYILRLDGELRETEVLVFRGGTVLSSGFDKHVPTRIWSSSVEVSSKDDLTGLLTRFTERA